MYYQKESPYSAFFFPIIGNKKEMICNKGGLVDSIIRFL